MRSISSSPPQKKPLLSYESGGKSGRKDAEEDEEQNGRQIWTIQPITGEVKIKADDPPALREMIAAASFDIPKIIGDMG